MKSIKYILPNSVHITPVSEFPLEIRSKIKYDEGDYIIYRPGYRALPSLIDSQTKVLLSFFRSPQRIVDSVIKFSQYLHEDPYEVLEKTHPVVNSFIQNKILVEEDSPLIQETSAIFEVGEEVDVWTIQEIIQVQEDTQVYKVINGQNERAALKVAGNNLPEVKRKLQFESEVLKKLDGDIAPQLISEGIFKGLYYFIMEWVEGQTILNVSHQLEQGDQLALMVKLVEAYSRIHDGGVFHCDLNPRNILYVDGSIRIIDFGEAFYEDHRWNKLIHRSPSFEWLIDPESAEAILKHTIHHYDSRSEVYRLCALLYRLYTRKGYLPEKVSTVESYQEVLTGRPLSFVENEALAWPGLQAILFKGLEKKPENRFKDAAELLEKLLGISLPQHTQKNNFGSFHFRVNYDDLLNQYDAGAVDLCIPTHSMQSGIGGIGFTLMRYGMLENNSAALFHGLTLVEQTDRLEDKNGYLSKTGFPPISVSSVPHQYPGLLLLRIMLHHLLGQRLNYAEETEKFLSYGSENEIMEYSFGLGGYLIGLVQLFEIVKARKVESEKVLSKAREILNRFEKWIHDHDLNTFPNLGFAHGWAGILYAYMTAAKGFNLPIPHSIEKRLEEISGKAMAMNKGITWPSALDDPYPIVGSGWCSGSAGYVWLWLKAYDVFNKKAFFNQAEQSALWTFYDPESKRAHLCCGMAGRMMALLKMYVASGDGKWLYYAHKLGQKAQDVPANSEKYQNNLFWGEIGKKYAFQEMKHPTRVVFPLVDIVSFSNVN